MDPMLWRRLNLSQKKISADILKGIVRRQPRHLDLSWTKITRKQLFWLICRLPQLQSLSLSGCSSSVLPALFTCNCPKMECLDLSWADSLDDDLIQELLSPPNDTRPGLMETKTRLRFLTELKLSGNFTNNKTKNRLKQYFCSYLTLGSNISDKSIRLITQHLPFVSRLDLSNCHKVTDMVCKELIHSLLIQCITD